MATESPLIHDGSQTVLSTANDARRSSITGTTLNGPNGSAQFYPVYISTGRVVSLVSTTFQNMSTSTPLYGILQNTPGPGQAADVGILGITKAISGSSSIIGGTVLQTSSTAAGQVTPFVGGNGRPWGISLETVTSAGAVFTALMYGAANGGPST
jgi:hypothetical protein